MEQAIGLEIFTPGGATVAGLTAIRISGVMWTAPALSTRALTPQLKTALLVVLVIVMWPSAMANSGTVEFSVSAVLGEALIGLTLGLGAAIFVGAAESAGDMLAVQMGLSGANVVNPMSQTMMPILGQFLGLFVTALILASGGHVVILAALSRSLEMLPAGAPLDLEGGIKSVIDLGATLLWLGVRMAAPVIAAMMIANTTLGVLARTVPQLNVLMVAFPVQICIGLFMLGATLPVITKSFVGWDATYEDLASSILQSLTPSEGGR